TAFEELSRAVRPRDLPVLVAIFPVLLDPGGVYPAQEEHERVARLAARYGLSVIDLRPAFQTRGLERVRVHAEDIVHPNAEAMTITAEEIHKALQSDAEMSRRLARSPASPFP